MIGQSSPANVSAGPDARSQRWRMAGICLGLAAITFAVFGQTLRHEFVNYDDDIYVYDNPGVLQGLTFKNFVWAFTRTRADNWHPLTWLSHMMDCQWYGLHPWGHHLTNVLLHIATVIGLFLVLRAMTGALWRCAFVAAVFAIHPLRAESVAWVAERKDVLSGLFFVLTLGAYIRYARRSWSAVRYGAVMVLFSMGLMCKPMLVTLPAVLLLLDYWPLQRTASLKFPRLVMEKLPLLALSVAACAVTLLAQQGNIQSSESYPLALRLGNALVSCMVYLRQMIYPAGLALLYPFPQTTLPAWQLALSGILLACLSLIAFKQRRTRPWIWIGWLWYLVMLLPVIGIIQVGEQAHADRYTYLPQIGVYVALAWTAAEWAAKQQARRLAAGGLMAGCIVALMMCAWRQTAYWENSEVLWNRTLACAPKNPTARLNLGMTLLRKNRMDEAISEFEKALEIKTNYAEAHDDLGIALFNEGKIDEARDHFHKALEIKPDSADAYYNLGMSFYQQGRLDEAASLYEHALKIEPDYEEARLSLGIALCRMGRVDEGIADFQQVVQSNPQNAKAHNSLGNALAMEGRRDEAIAEYRKVLQLQPGHAGAHDNLGNALLQNGQPAEALRQFQAALQIEPANPKFQISLASLLATSPEASLRNGQKAVELAEQANAATGGKQPVVLQTLAAAYAEAGRFSDAATTAGRAMQMANAQSNARLASQLQTELALYQAGKPFHGGK